MCSSEIILANAVESALDIGLIVGEAQFRRRIATAAAQNGVGTASGIDPSRIIHRVAVERREQFAADIARAVEAYSSAHASALRAATDMHIERSLAAGPAAVFGHITRVRRAMAAELPPYTAEEDELWALLYRAGYPHDDAAEVVYGTALRSAKHGVRLRQRVMAALGNYALAA